MNEASRVAEQDAVLLQLAAGGFRDMTRVAAGDPTIWPDVLFENREAISQSLEALEGRLAALRAALIGDDHDDDRRRLGERRLGPATTTRSGPGLGELGLSARRRE